MDILEYETPIKYGEKLNNIKFWLQWDYKFQNKITKTKIEFIIILE